MTKNCFDVYKQIGDQVKHPFVKSNFSEEKFKNNFWNLQMLEDGSNWANPEKILQK